MIIGEQATLLAEALNLAPVSLLQSLNISRCRLTSNTSKAIASACVKAKVKYVNFDFNFIRSEIAEEFSKLLKSNGIECIINNLSVPSGGRIYY